MSTIFAPAFFAISITLLGVAIFYDVKWLIVYFLFAQTESKAAPAMTFANNRRSVELFFL
jgi:hypothetical protein